MNIVQTNDLLTHIQTIDNRQVGDSTVLEWHELVADLDYDEALEGARMHFRESEVYLKPAHIRLNIERMRRAALGPQEDEYGNQVDPEPAALASAQRVAGSRKAVTS